VAGAHKINVELEVADIELLVSALRLAGSTRTLGRRLGEAIVPKLMPQLAPPTPKADEREKLLLDKLLNILGH
jgi:hypothetical protein